MDQGAVAALVTLILGMGAGIWRVVVRRDNQKDPVPKESAALAMADRIDAILMRPALRRADWGIEVRDAASNRVLYARSADHLFVPASILKLLVTSTAAHYLRDG